MLNDIIRTTNAKRVGAGFLGQCPVHDDRQASLSIAEREGKVLVKCHAGCEQADIVQALKDKGAWPTASTRPEPEAVYPYKDAAGVLQYSKVRYPGKNWSIKWESDSRNRYLYNLPQILNSTNNPIWFVEGEKDANNLTRLKQTATTNDCGAGAGKVTPELAAPLAGKTIIICGDNDEPGQKHIAALQGVLQAVAAKVLLVKLPLELAGRRIKDITDYLDIVGHTEAELAKVAAGAQQVWPVKTVFTYSELLDIDLPMPETWLGGFVGPNQATMVVALPGVGKTWFTMAIAQVLGNGDKKLGHWQPKARKKTLIVDFEMGPVRIKHRLEALAKGYGITDSHEHIGLLCPELCHMSGITFSDLSNPTHLRILHDACKDYDLIVIDNVNAAFPMSADDENSPKFWAEPQSLVLGLRRLGKSCIVVHHATKGDPKNPAGSAKNVRFFDNVLALVDETDYTTTDVKKIKVYVKKSRDFPSSRENQPELELRDYQGGAHWALVNGISSITLPESSERPLFDFHSPERDDIPW